MIRTVLRACGLTDEFSKRLLQRPDAGEICESPLYFVEGVWEEETPLGSSWCCAKTGMRRTSALI